jgi:protein-S-isoprenylcysteine O-methyltransferase Ste14
MGGWLFKRRTSIPLPIVAALLLVPSGDSGSSSSTRELALGVLLVMAGEGLRLSAVHHIGAISRTRSDRLGPLIESGPFGLVRNPLYLGNILLWLGFTVSARLLWLAPIVLVLLALEYHAIVRWEEGLLESRQGAAYQAYCERVPRWIPRLRRASRDIARPTTFSWRATIFSERGTLIAIFVGYLLLAVKARVFGY